MPDGMVCVSTVACELPRRRQRGHLQAQTHHRLAMADEVIRIGLTVAANVWGVRIGRIGPPVIPFGKEVMAPAGAARVARRRDGDRLFAE